LKMGRLIFLFLTLLAGARAECPNACSGHGTCGKFDQCTCYPNYQGADCSLRTCPFELAHVDTPKGDLDSSADALSGTQDPVLWKSTVYPYGTTEQFPSMKDSIGQTRYNTAHYYMECGNKGICDRKTGECECFEGYEGAGCKRASCPNQCNGHGTCEHIKTLAEWDYGNHYDLWDAEMTMGCACDPGYYGSDCSSRYCKMGVDPLYTDDDATARLQTTDFTLTGVGSHRVASNLEGTYAIKFYDVFGEDYVTDPIDVDGAGCDDIVEALYALPNTVIPSGSVDCYDGYDREMTETNDLITDKIHNHTRSYSLTFTGNPGVLKQLEIDMYLDGDRPTLRTRLNTTGDQDITGEEGSYGDYSRYLQFGDVSADVYTTGISGEFVDYFADQCEDVTLKIKGAEITANTISTLQSSQGITVEKALRSLQFTSGYSLDELTDAELKRLKICLGDSDGYSSNNIEVYDWDYGSYQDTISKGLGGTPYGYNMQPFPHAIKLVKEFPADDNDGGNFYLTWWDPTVGSLGEFKLVNPPSKYKTTDTEPLTEGNGRTADETKTKLEQTRYNVYTTDGVVERVRHRCGDNAVLCKETGGDNVIQHHYSDNNEVTAYVEEYANVLYTDYDVSCETAPDSVQPCLDKGDLIFVVDTFYYQNDTRTGRGTTGGYQLPTYDTYESGNLYEIKKMSRDDSWSGVGDQQWNSDYYQDYDGDGDKEFQDLPYQALRDTSESDDFLAREYQDKFSITLDKNVPFKGDELYGPTDAARDDSVRREHADGTQYVGFVNIFKFSPATTGTYTYVSECSNRGVCDSEVGVCECFKGYTSDDCSVQSSIAV